MARPGRQKTRKSVSKRIKKSGSGRLLRAHANHRHRLVAKSKKAKGKSKYSHAVASGDGKQALRGLAS